MTNFNNNVEISGKYLIVWWRQPPAFSHYQTFLSKIGLNPELICQNLALSHLHIETAGDGLALNFSRNWDDPVVTENIKPGTVVVEEEYEAVWYRFGNKLVKQAKPRRMTPAYTVTREFLEASIITTFSTDNNTLKASVLHTKL